MSAVQPAMPAVGDAPATRSDAQERRILLLAPTANDARLTADFLTDAGFDVQSCLNIEEVCANLKQGCGAAVLAEEALGSQPLAVLFAALEAQPSWSDVPITIITAGGEAVRHRLRRLAVSGPANNVALIERPFHPETLVSTVEVALRARQRQYEIRDLLRKQRASERLYRAVGESIDYGIWICDEQGRNTYTSESFLKLVGLTQEQCSHFGWSSVLHPEDTEATIAAWQECVRAQSLWEREHRIKGVDGGWHPILARGVPVRDDHGKVVRWVGINLDIARIKRTEQALSEQTRRVAEQARLFDTTLSHIADLAYTFDLEGRVIYANEPLLKIWGLTMEEARGKNCFDLKYPEELARRLHAQLVEVGVTGRPIKGETTLASSTGAVDYHEYIYNPVFAPDGRVVAVAGTTRLITERKRIESALQEAKDTAEAASAAKDRFLAVLSHELRTPLTPVLMAVAAMEVDPELPAAIKADITMIRRNVELETKLIDDLLDLSRVTSGKLRLRLESVDLNEVVRFVSAICRSPILEKGIRLHESLCASPAFVTADPARLQQVLWNVLKNAVKFTPEGGRIDLATRHGDGGRVEVRIRDSGIGIDQEILPNIFDAFEQGDARITRQFGGLGLGLAISKALIEMHGGTIRVESEGAGMGSLFVIELPLEVAKPETVAPTAPSGRNDSSGTVRLLVIEDHPDTLRVLARLLRSEGFQVQTADHVAGALALAAANPFDVVVSDLGLPDGTGYELMRRLRANYPITGIAMSGYGMDEDLRRSREAGFRHHLVKPVDVPQLIRAIQDVVQNHAE